MSASTAAKTKARRRGRRLTSRPHPARPSSGPSGHLLPEGEGGPEPTFGPALFPPEEKGGSAPLLAWGEGGAPKARRMRAFSLRPHLQIAKGGAAVTIGVIHVFGRRWRINVATGRNGAHDIGNGDERRLALGAIERRHEAVIAIFSMHGLGVLA